MAPKALWNEPGAHVAHRVVAFAAANVPGAHGAHCSALEPPPNPRNVPGGHAAHAEAPSTAAKVPGAHASQTEAPGAPATRPRGHTTQVSAEASSVNVPAGHVTHAPVARSRRVPGRHARRTATVNPSPAAASLTCASRCTSCGSAALSTRPALAATWPTVQPQPYAVSYTHLTLPTKA